MSVNFIAHPEATFRLGDFLKQSLADPQWTEFRAAIAFVKRSGTKHIRQALENFVRRGGSAIVSAGVDARGTSIEGLIELMEAVGGGGSVYVFHNAGSATFHPKIYLFRNNVAALLVVGSCNLTEGGLFTNYESNVLLELNLTVSSDEALLTNVTEALNAWSTPRKGLCYELDSRILELLKSGGYITHEVWTSGDEKTSNGYRTASESNLFVSHAIPLAPRASRMLLRVNGLREDPSDKQDREISPAVLAQSGSHTAFLMTLQNTDVGVGQTTRGASRRSPEIFIPLKARDYDPDFWGWPDHFEEDRSWKGVTDGEGRGKMDRSGVMFRLGGATFPVHMWYNPNKKDLRLRSEHLRSAGSIGDILYIERSRRGAGYTYYADVVPQGSARHTELLSRCTETVRNSKKHFGYL